MRPREATTPSSPSASPSGQPPATTRISDILPIAARALLLVWVLLVTLARYAWERAWLAQRLRRSEADAGGEKGGAMDTIARRARLVSARDALRGRLMAEAFERLGATFVKLGQILATRPDVLPPEITSALARLHDAVPPAPYEEVERVLAAELSPEARARVRVVETEPIAAASVAQVHRGVLSDGTVVAIKVQRLAARWQIERDLSLLTLGARLLDLWPSMRWISVPGAIERFAAALRAQLDFELEARNNRRLAKNFAGSPRVRVPDLVEGLCTRRVLTMEFIHGGKPTDVTEGRKELALAGLRCIAQMVFLDGFVHADMHPGNLLMTRDGVIVLIDLGLVAEIPEPMRKAWVETFVAIAARDGRRAAQLLYEHAPTIGNTDYAAFEAEIVSHLDDLRNRPLAELEVTAAVGGAMGILRKHQVQADPSFTVVQLAMVVAEGVGKQLDPDLDVLTCVAPFLAMASERWTTGAEPRRRVPRPAAA